MNILITGGAGFIGSNLIDLINKRKKNCSIFVIDNESLGKKNDIKGKIKNFYKYDISKNSTFKKIGYDYDCVIHLAAFTEVVGSVKFPKKIMKDNVIGTFNVLEYCRKFEIKNVIIASTGGAIIGETKKMIFENTLPRPISPYGVSKLWNENLAFSYNSLYDMNISCVRFANVYGPGCHRKKDVITTFLKRINKKKVLHIYGSGKQQRDYIFVKDVCDGILKVLNRKKAGVYQFSSLKTTSINDLIDLLQEIVGKNFVIYKNYNSKRKGEVNETIISNYKAKRELDFKSNVNLKKGLTITWDWLIKNKSILQ